MSEEIAIWILVIGAVVAAFWFGTVVGVHWEKQSRELRKLDKLHKRLSARD